MDLLGTAVQVHGPTVHFTPNILGCVRARLISRAHMLEQLASSNVFDYNYIVAFPNLLGFKRSNAICFISPVRAAMDCRSMFL
jgi:hypothetical protein